MSTAGHYYRAVAHRGLSVYSRGNAAVRTFATSTPYQKHGGPLPSFEESSSPALNDVLLTIRSKYLVPAHLNTQQKKLVSQRQHRARLENEDLYATIGDEDVRLEHLDVQERPHKGALFKRALELAKEPKDWDNLLKVLEGFRRAKERVAPAWMAKLVRKANEAGMQHVVLESIRRVASTGLSLRYPDVLHHVLEGIHLKAQESGWERIATLKALGYAEQVMELLENPLHQSAPSDTHTDPRLDPSVFGIVFEMAAVRAHRYPAKTNPTVTVQEYADRLLTLWEQPGGGQFYNNNFSTAIEAGRFMDRWVPVWHGLTLAQKVLGQGMPRAEAAQRAAQTTERDINSAADVVRSTLPAEQAEKKHGMIAWRKCIR